MRNNRCLFYYIFLLLLGTGIACQKEEKVYPDIVIKAPEEGSRYAFGDTIYAEFSAAPADRVNFSITRDGNPVNIDSRQLFKDQDRYEVAFYYRNKYLQGGSYTLKISADNGEAHSSEFRDIFLGDLSLRQRGFVFLANDKLYRVDSAGNSISVSLGGSYDFMETNSRYNQVVVASQQANPLKGYDFNQLTPAYSKSIPRPGSNEQYSALQYYDGRMYSFDLEGNIVAYGEGGSQARSIGMPTDRRPVAPCFYDEELYVVGEQPGNPNKDLYVLNPGNGFVKRQQFLNSGQIGLVPFAENKVTVFRNTGTQMYFYTYNTESRQLTNNFILNNEKFRDGELLTEGRILFTTDKTTYLYYESVEQGPEKILNQPMVDIEVDRNSRQAYVLHNGLIQNLLPNGNLQYAAQAQSGATDFEIMYNK